MTVHYEWDLETVAHGDQEQYEDGEVLEHYHAKTFAEVLAWRKDNPPLLGTRYEIVLVRDDNLQRTWAYTSRKERHNRPDQYTLPLHFEDANGVEATKVPARFRNEIS
jgi:hypothetical protein